MPHLLLFAPCRKAIIDKGDNSISLIEVMHGLIAHPPEGIPKESLPPNAVAPLNWGIGTVWLRLPEDSEKTFEQRLEIISPNNTKYESSVVQTFKMTHRTHQIALNAHTFPVGETGEYRFVLYLREVGGEWRQVAEYPVEVRFESGERSHE
jgi:hypothetical protein